MSKRVGKKTPCPDTHSHDHVLVSPEDLGFFASEGMFTLPHNPFVAGVCACGHEGIFVWQKSVCPQCRGELEKVRPPKEYARFDGEFWKCTNRKCECAVVRLDAWLGW